LHLSNLNESCVSHQVATANFVIVPIAADYYSHEGVIDLQETLQKAKRGNAQLSVLGYFMTRFDSRMRVAKESLKLTQDKFKELAFKTVIRELASIKTAPAMRLTIFEHDATGQGAADYSSLVDKVIERLEINKSSVPAGLRVVKNDERKVS
jgi:chromosome partitioning protein